jgi:putative alpha-1,2-mannosidase
MAYREKLHRSGQGNSAENLYIQSATLNKNPLNRAWITHSEITKG